MKCKNIFLFLILLFFNFFNLGCTIDLSIYDLSSLAGIITEDSTIPGNFAITGMTGGTDTVLDTFLSDLSSVKVNLSSATGVQSYVVEIWSDDLSVKVCGPVSSGSPVVLMGACVLVDNTSYRVKAYAVNIKGQTAATNSSSFSFKVLTSTPIALLSGTPQNVDAASTLNITVAGAGVVSYQYKVGVSTTNICTIPTGYSGDVSVAVPIADNLSGFVDGGMTVCVLGKDANGLYQLLSNPTSYTWTKDTTAPVVVDVTTNLPDGTYGTGQTISIQIHFSEVVDVTGLPQLGINLSPTFPNAAYTSGSGTNTLTFEYTTIAGESANPLDVTSTSALSLNGGTIQDAGGNNGILTLPSNGSGNSLSENSTIVIINGAVPPGNFSISGVIGGNDSAVDGFLTDLSAVAVKVSTATGADTYSAEIWTSDLSIKVCGPDSSVTTSVTLNACSLTAETSYIVKATADNAAGQTLASNNGTFSFLAHPSTPTAILSGTPSNFHQTFSLNISISGADIVAYQYKVGLSATTICTLISGYSSDIPVSTPITDNLSAQIDGNYTVCVLGKDSAGAYQPVTSPSLHTWTKDTSAPLAAISGAPSGESDTTTLSVTINGTGVTHYKFKVGASAGINCQDSSGYSAETASAVQITDSIVGLPDGDITLCVVARDAAGNYQTYSSATSATWTKNTAAPPLIATITGAPKHTSNAVDLDVTVGGAGISVYKYKLGSHNAVDCTDSTGYSADTPIATLITDNFSAFLGGPVTLCVIGGDGVGNYQSYTTPTVAEWIKQGFNPKFTWMSGSDVADPLGAYGNKGVPNANNVPGARDSGQSWFDNEGNFWVYGGESYDEAGNWVYHDDLWKYSTETRQWTWVGGEEKKYNVAGVFGIKKEPSINNYPGMRAHASTIVDAENNLWLFGGYGKDLSSAKGDMNDLWKYNPYTQEWTWISGAGLIAQTKTGNLDETSVNNTPGCRELSGAWIDNAGKFWIFGGSCSTSYFNDLWVFDPTAETWTWKSGDAVAANRPGIHGTKGTPSTSNIPGSRKGMTTWTDEDGNLWLFGGSGYDSAGVFSSLNDLWKYNPTTGEWTWINGSTTGSQNSNFGVQGVSNATNVLGARQGAYGWSDSLGNFWLFGGSGRNDVFEGKRNDVWRYSIADNIWTWIAGDKNNNVNGVYGTKGVTSPTNKPGSRGGSWDAMVGGKDGQENAWIFSGNGYDRLYYGNNLNDLWMFSTKASILGPSMINKGEIIDLTTIGGVPPYTYTIVSGDGTVDAGTGRFTGPNANGTTVIRVADSSGDIVGEITVETLPNARMAINNEVAVTANPQVNLAILNSSDATKMYITNTPNCSGGGTWENIGTRAWVVKNPQVNGTKFVYYKLKGTNGKETGCRKTVITLRTAPAIINAGSSFTTNQNVSLAHTAYPEATEMFVTQNATCNIGSWVSFSASSSWTLENANALNKIYVKYRNNSFVESPCVKSEIIHGSVAPVATINSPPTGLNESKTYSLTIGGADIVEYRYLVTAQVGTTCSQIENYSVAQSVAAPIIFNLNNFTIGNSVQVCVIGKNSAGVWQSEFGPTIASWLYDYYEVNFVNLEKSIMEDSGPQTIRVQLNHPAIGDFPIRFNLNGSTVTPSQYNLNSLIVTIPSGQSYVDFTFDPVHALTVDPERRFQLNIEKLPAGAKTGKFRSVGFNIFDKEAPVHKTIIDVSLQWQNACLVDSVGALKCWGWYKLPATGNWIGSQDPVWIDPGTTYQKVAAGLENICALTTAGVIKCWGENADGEVGNGTFGTRVPDPVPINSAETFIDVASGYYNSCGLTTNHEVYCWGANWLGQLGQNTDIPARVGTPTLVDSGVQYSKIGVGEEHICGLTTAGTLKCWGWNGETQLGDGTWNDSFVPIVIDAGEKYIDLGVGTYYNCAVTQAGKVKCWGDNGHMQTGGSWDMAFFMFPTYVLDDDATYISIDARDYITCGITTDNDLKCWGWLSWWGLNYSTPQHLWAGKKFKKVSASNHYLCAITMEDNVECWGTPTIQNSPWPTVIVDDVQKYVGGSSVNYASTGSCTINSVGELKCWGQNNYGDVGDGTKTTKYSPVVVDPGQNYIEIVRGLYDVCGLTSDNDIKCWGNSFSTTTPKLMDSTTKYSKIFGYAGTYCGLTMLSKIKCWGNNSEGQVGNNSTTIVLSPTDVDSLTTYKTIFMGNQTNCGITTDDDLKCWGDNGYGQVGDNSIVDKKVPTIIDTGVKYKWISNGGFQTCGMTLDDDVKCWGYNTDGTIGTGGTTNILVPTAVDSPTKYKGVYRNAGNANRTCGITQDDELKCWGRKLNADGSLTNIPLPTIVDSGTLYNSLAYFINGNVWCGTTASGALKCWGAGATGNGTTDNQPDPVTVDGATTYKPFAYPRGGIPCAITVGSQLKCWGSNHDNSQGIGFDKSVPRGIMYLSE